MVIVCFFYAVLAFLHLLFLPFRRIDVCVDEITMLPRFWGFLECTVYVNCGESYEEKISDLGNSEYACDERKLSFL